MSNVPEWATAMIGNYRSQFEAKYKQAFPLDDARIFTVIKEVGVLSDGKETDEAVIEEMFYLLPSADV